jgi:hypothetical protein
LARAWFADLRLLQPASERVREEIALPFFILTELADKRIVIYHAVERSLLWRDSVVVLFFDSLDLM